MKLILIASLLLSSISAFADYNCKDGNSSFTIKYQPDSKIIVETPAKPRSISYPFFGTLIEKSGTVYHVEENYYLAGAAGSALLKVTKDYIYTGTYRGCRSPLGCPGDGELHLASKVTAELDHAGQVSLYTCKKIEKN